MLDFNKKPQDMTDWQWHERHIKAGVTFNPAGCAVCAADPAAIAAKEEARKMLAEIDDSKPVPKSYRNGRRARR